ncbi:MAG TPA: aminopeptidase [Candidatus Edwardsbacteria bacterium]|nr:aminopeptidase [Candidatus Edwardsbacteria bacterium]
MAAKHKLGYESNPAWDSADKRTRAAYHEFAADYAAFIDHGRTERLATAALVKLAEKAGFVALDRAKGLKPGSRVYAVNRGKNILLAVIGTQPLERGVNLIASHLDAPRIDLKPRPLFEDEDLKLALLRTHYYGGVKKYQWASQPLGLYGTVVRRDGSSVDVAIGAKAGDPCFVIPDLLPHLARKEQGERKSGETIKGEEMLIVCGGIPVEDREAKGRVKTAVLEHLHAAYGIEEEDLISAELEAVPLAPARFVGFDKSLIGGYGQDDRICCYTAARAIVDLKVPDRTTVVACVDKEEIGSEGNTGMQSNFLMNFLGQMLELHDPKYPEHKLRSCLAGSCCISADVNAGVEPNFKQVHELSNAAKAGFGLVLTKYTGHGGKGGANDASAEFTGKVRKIFNDAKVPWQAAELGKVDEGGGGTVAKFLAEYDMEVIDCGPALLSMHSPFELVSVADLYATYQGYKAFLENA